MKRLYYKLEMRMGIIFKEYESNDLLVENFYYSDGYCIIEDGKIIGFLTDDLFKAAFTKRNFAMELLYSDYDLDENGELSKERLKYNFSANLNEKFELPSEVILACKHEESNENILITLDFLSKVTDVNKQNRIYEDLVEAGLL